MTQRRRPLSAGFAGLLALVLLRSLVPTGFMPAWVDGRLALVLCEGQGALPAVVTSGHHHHHHADTSTPATAHHAGEDCAYAQSAHPAMALAAELPPAPQSPMAAALPAAKAHAPFYTLPRYRAPRGPPIPA